MKTYHIFRPLFLLSLFICGVNHCKAMNISDDSQDDIPDRLTFGLVGDVKEVQISITDNSDDMVDDPINEEQVMTFDKEGRVTRDIHDCEYVYDTQGRFIKGEKEYTKMVRDKKGRIKSYETRLDDEDAECYCYTYEYDLNGRPTTIGLQLWEGVYTHTFTYSGNNIYPDKLVVEGDEQGDHYTIVTTYEYKAFDKYGNWTERVCNTESRISSEGVEGVTQESMSTLEQRGITYYE